MTGKERALMLENTPRMVCLPDAGSMWTPSQVIQARREGFDCTSGGWAGAGERQTILRFFHRGKHPAATFSLCMVGGRFLCISVKYIFVTGGVVSSLGKGLTAGALGALLEMRGLKVRIQK